MQSKFYIRKFADMHVHLRHTDPIMLKKVIRHTARVCEYAVVMPNTDPPTITAEDIAIGRREIRTHADKWSKDFKPLMMMKMEANCHPDLIREAKTLKAVGTKCYPEGVTTNSNTGLTQQFLNEPTTNIKECWEEQQNNGMISSWHGEMPDSFVMNAETDFLPFIINLAKNYPKLKIVLEHITTKAAVEVVMNNLHKNIAATITYHHLRTTLDDVLKNKLRPHHYCKPIPKTPDDRKALLEAAFSGHPNFFLGSDSAPHDKNSKECEYGCAGVYSSPCLVEGMVDLFSSVDKLNKLEQFACVFGPEFYGLPPSASFIGLEYKSCYVSPEIDGIVPFHAGEKLTWSIFEV